MKYICKKFINHQTKKCFLFRCRHAVVIMQTLNWTNQCALFMRVRDIFVVSEDNHQPIELKITGTLRSSGSLKLNSTRSYTGFKRLVLK